MSNKREEYPINFHVNFVDGIGEIEPDAFEKNLPPGLTMETVNSVYSFVDQFAAHGGEHLLNKAEEHFQSNDSDLIIADYNMGDNATLAMSISKDYSMLTSITVSSNEALAAIEERARQLGKERNE